MDAWRRDRACKHVLLPAFGSNLGRSGWAPPAGAVRPGDSRGARKSQMEQNHNPQEPQMERERVIGFTTDWRLFSSDGRWVTQIWKPGQWHCPPAAAHVHRIEGEFVIYPTPQWRLLSRAGRWESQLERDGLWHSQDAGGSPPAGEQAGTNREALARGTALAPLQAEPSRLHVAARTAGPIGERLEAARAAMREAAAKAEAAASSLAICVDLYKTANEDLAARAAELAAIGEELCSGGGPGMADRSASGGSAEVSGLGVAVRTAGPIGERLEAARAAMRKASAKAEAAASSLAICVDLNKTANEDLPARAADLFAMEEELHSSGRPGEADRSASGGGRPTATRHAGTAFQWRTGWCCRVEDDSDDRVQGDQGRELDNGIVSHCLVCSDTPSRSAAHGLCPTCERIFRDLGKWAASLVPFPSSCQSSARSCASDTFDGGPSDDVVFLCTVCRTDLPHQVRTPSTPMHQLCPICKQSLLHAVRWARFGYDFWL